MNKNLILLLAIATTTLSGTDKLSDYPLIGGVYLDTDTLRRSLEQVYPQSPLTITLEQIATGDLSKINTASVRTIFITRSSAQTFTPELMREVIQRFQDVEHIKLINLELLADQKQEFLSHFHALKSIKIIESTHTKLGISSLKNPSELSWRLLNRQDNGQDIVEQRLTEYRIQQQQQTENLSQALRSISITQDPRDNCLSFDQESYPSLTTSSSNGDMRQNDSWLTYSSYATGINHQNTPPQSPPHANISTLFSSEVAERRRRSAGPVAGTNLLQNCSRALEQSSERSSAISEHSDIPLSNQALSLEEYASFMASLDYNTFLSNEVFTPPFRESEPLLPEEARQNVPLVYNSESHRDHDVQQVSANAATQELPINNSNGLEYHSDRTVSAISTPGEELQQRFDLDFEPIEEVD